MLATEIAARNPKTGSDWETVACILSKDLSTGDKLVQITDAHVEIGWNA